MEVQERTTHENIALSLIRDAYDRLLLVFKEGKDGQPGVWMLPGGHIDKGEKIKAAADRENVEETTLAGIAGYHFLFYLEEIREEHQRVFFIHEGFYLGDSLQPKIRLPKKLLTKERLTEAKWFAQKELGGIPISSIANEAIKKAAGLKDVNPSFYHFAMTDFQRLIIYSEKTLGQKEAKKIKKGVLKLAKIVKNVDKKTPPIKPKKEPAKVLGQKEIVLIVEDNASLAELTKELLEEFFQVVIFNRPSTATEWLNSSSQNGSLPKIKAILVDNHFDNEPAGKNGVKFIREINALYPLIKTILFTASPVNSGYTGSLLLKPASTEEIISAIKAEETKT